MFLSRPYRAFFTALLIASTLWFVTLRPSSGALHIVNQTFKASKGTTAAPHVPEGVPQDAVVETTPGGSVAPKAEVDTSRYAPVIQLLDLSKPLLAANSTLGFAAIAAVSTLSSKRRSSLLAAAEITGLNITIPNQPLWTDKDIKDLRSEKHSIISRGSALAWLGHLNVLRWFLQTDLATLLVLEDDVDWDIHLRTSQVPQVAAVTRFLLDQQQHLEKKVDTRDTSENYWGPPDSWDVLYLGHCGDGFQRSSWSSGVLRAGFQDQTLPVHADLHGVTRASLDAIDMKEGVRMVHQSISPLCTFGFALTRKSARAIVEKIAPKEADAGTYAYDVRILEACRDEGLRCWSTNPELFHHMNAPSEIETIDRKKNMTTTDEPSAAKDKSAVDLAAAKHESAVDPLVKDKLAIDIPAAKDKLPIAQTPTTRDVGSAPTPIDVDPEMQLTSDDDRMAPEGNDDAPGTETGTTRPNKQSVLSKLELQSLVARLASSRTDLAAFQRSLSKTSSRMFANVLRKLSLGTPVSDADLDLSSDDAQADSIDPLKPGTQVYRAERVRRSEQAKGEARNEAKVKEEAKAKEEKKAPKYVPAAINIKCGARAMLARFSDARHGSWDAKLAAPELDGLRLMIDEGKCYEVEKEKAV